MKITQNLKRGVRDYLKAAPLFMAIIRAQEIELFNLNKQYLTGKVLDFGCGDGFFASVSFKNSNLIKNLVGIDLTSNLRTTIAKNNQIYQKLFLYDGRKLPFQKNSFDSVASNCVFEHIPKIADSVAEIYRVLKPGGYCVTSVMTDQWDNLQLGRKIVGFWYSKWMRQNQVHVSLLSSKGWQKLFESAGFEVVSQTGYVGETCAAWLDIAHYFSFPALIWYKLTGKWSLWPELTTLPWTNLILKIVTLPVKKHAAEFFVLRKI